jgi:hypothetical protein
MATKIRLSIPAPKKRKPVAKKPNTVMKSKKDYTRKIKNGKKRREHLQEE